MVVPISGRKPEKQGVVDCWRDWTLYASMLLLRPEGVFGSEMQSSPPLWIYCISSNSMTVVS